MNKKRIRPNKLFTKFLPLFLSLSLSLSLSKTANTYIHIYIYLSNKQTKNKDKLSKETFKMCQLKAMDFGVSRYNSIEFVFILVWKTSFQIRVFGWTDNFQFNWSRTTVNLKWGHGHLFWHCYTLKTGQGHRNWQKWVTFCRGRYLIRFRFDSK